jgi:hypothetical protein
MREATKQQKTLTFEQAEQATAESNDVRRDLLERFRFLVDTGRYDVSNLAIAEAMIADGVMGNELPLA